MSDLDNHITGHYGEDQFPPDTSDIRERMLITTLRRIRAIALDGNLPPAVACREIADAAAWRIRDLDYEV